MLPLSIERTVTQATVGLNKVSTKSNGLAKLLNVVVIYCVPDLTQMVLP